MKCAQCNKTLKQETIATKTRKQGGNVVVLQSRQALVCSEHGVVAWDPHQQVINVPYVPIPYGPWQPRPWIQPQPIYTQPNSTPINPNRYPTITCGQANGLSNTRALNSLTGWHEPLALGPGA